MISVGKVGNLCPSKQLRFSTITPENFDAWTSLLTTRTWSPIVWKDGYRLSQHFIGSKYIVIDCDDGVSTLADTIEFCRDNGFAHLIGTTKSHQRPKGNEPPCDRFRLVLVGDHELKDRELYEYNMKLHIDYFHADASCSDSARFYFPCKEVVSFGTGKKVEWKLAFEDDYVPFSKRWEARRRQYATKYSKLILPVWITDIISGRTVIPAGMRHKTAYRLGAIMGMWYGPEEIAAMMGRTSLSGIGQHDLLRAISNGYKAENGQ